MTFKNLEHNHTLTDFSKGKEIKIMKLKELMKKEKTKRETLANQLQIPTATLDNYIAERRQPDIDTLIKLADFYHTSIDYLVGRETELINLNGIKPIKKRLILDILNMNDLQELRAQSYFDGLFQR